MGDREGRRAELIIEQELSIIAGMFYWDESYIDLITRQFLRDTSGSPTLNDLARRIDALLKSKDRNNKEIQALIVMSLRGESMGWRVEQIAVEIARINSSW